MSNDEIKKNINKKILGQPAKFATRVIKLK